MEVKKRLGVGKAGSLSAIHGPRLTSCSHLVCGDCIAEWFNQHPKREGFKQLGGSCLRCSLLGGLTGRLKGKRKSGGLKNAEDTHTRD